MDDTFDPPMEMHTSPQWDGNGNDLSMFDMNSDLAMDMSTDMNTDSNEPAFDLNTYLNMDTFGDSPAPALTMAQFGDESSDFKFGAASPAMAAHTLLQPRTVATSSSPESSSHDSSSDSSSGNKKRKTSSESSPAAVSDALYMRPGQTWIKKEPRQTAAHTKSRNSLTAAAFNSTLADPEIESINRSMAGGVLNFGSAASSPGYIGNGLRDQASPNHISHSASHSMEDSVPSIATVRPAATFSFGSRDQSPASATIAHSNEPSPGLFNNPAASESPTLFQQPPMFTAPGQTHVWPNNISMAGVEMSPSPTAHTAVSQLPPHSSAYPTPQCTLHIDPISEKSRVETQINVRLTLAPAPHSATKLHLPRHTISKPKLLAKEEDLIKAPEILELHTTLVCTSAMEKPGLLKRAFDRAAGIETPAFKKERRRASAGDADEDTDEYEKPCDGGEVRICDNCMQRERKRASRKRVKKGEDETEWYKYEKERVIVFNTTEYKDWQQPATTKDGEPVPSQWPPGTLQIVAPMRIACYCRHQNEKIGFRAIFTIKDFMGRCIAQGITSSISITDDHKTKEPHNGGAHIIQLPDYPSGTSYYPSHEVNTGQGDMHASLLHRSHYSTNDLPAMQQHYHQPLSFMTANGLPHNTGHISSQPASAAMTPHSRSRQASPTVQVGPNKKRKNSSVHRLPHSLTMTRADIPQPLTMPSSTAAMPSVGTAAGPSTFSPTTLSFMGATDLGYGMPAASIPQGMPPGPQTPGHNNGPITPGHRSASMENMPFHFYSVPNSAHPSRAPSPISSGRIPMNAINQVPAISSAAMHMSAVATAPYVSEPQPRRPRPIIHKILPPEGPVTGNIEVTILGMHFQRDMEVMFGENVATTTTYWAENTLVCLLPPAPQPGRVRVTFTHDQSTGYSSSSASTFLYVDNDREQLFELALRVVCQKSNMPNANNVDVIQFAQKLASEGWSGASGAQGHSGLHHRQVNGMSLTNLGMPEAENVLLKLLDILDLDDSPQEPEFDLTNRSGSTMLSLASGLGYDRFAAGLLARGANPNTRDKSGFTALMKAAMRGQTHLVRRLITKGADPTVRNVRGYKAIDYTTSTEIFTFLRQTQKNIRPRSRAGTPHRSRTNSMVATRPLWEPPSPSQTSITGYEAEYEDDAESSDGPDLWAHSRRGSSNWDVSRRGSHMIHATDIHPLSTPAPAGWAPPLAPAAAASMSAWREQIATQIQQFQQTYHQWNLPNSLQFRGLPPMPQIPDYQAYPLVRRISSLLPHNSMARPEASPSDGPSLPPAYEEIYPESKGVEHDSKEKTATFHAIAEAALDHMAGQTFDIAPSESSSNATVSTATLKGKGKLSLRLGKKALTKEQQDLLRRTHAEKMKKLGSDRRLFFIWIPILLVVLALMFRTHLPAITSWSPLPTQLAQQPVDRVVEVA